MQPMEKILEFIIDRAFNKDRAQQFFFPKLIKIGPTTIECKYKGPTFILVHRVLSTYVPAKLLWQYQNKVSLKTQGLSLIPPLPSDSIHTSPCSSKILHCFSLTEIDIVKQVSNQLQLYVIISNQNVNNRTNSLPKITIQNQKY